MLSGEIPLCIRQASCIRRSAQVTSIFRSSERIVVSFFRSNFLHLHHKKIWVFSEKNHIISLTIEARFPCHHSIKNAHFNNKFLPSLIAKSRDYKESPLHSKKRKVLSSWYVIGAMFLASAINSSISPGISNHFKYFRRERACNIRYGRHVPSQCQYWKWLLIPGEMLLLRALARNMAPMTYHEDNTLRFFEWSGPSL